MTTESEERMLKVIGEVPEGKLNAMKVAAQISAVGGRTSGMVVSGDHKGYWRSEAGNVSIFAVTRRNESLEDYQ